MSPPSDFEAGVSVVDSHLAFEALVKLDLGTGETEPSRLRRDLKASSIPLHDVVVADRALVQEAADAIESGRSGPPGLGRVARSAAETAVVVREEAAQHLIGGVQIGSPGQTQLAGEAVLEGAP